MKIFCKRFRKLFGMFVGLLFISIFLLSCTTELTLSVQPDDSVKIHFEGGAGQAFTKMISSASGVGSASAASLIDKDAVSYELARAGFSSVKVEEKNKDLVLIDMSDTKCSSYIFTSGIAKLEKNKLSAVITRRSLEDFYNSADEQTRMTLDLFLAPVFNNEIMSEAEYLEMLASFYGDAAADEVSQSRVKINLISKDGSRQSLNYPLAQLLCGNL